MTNLHTLTVSADLAARYHNILINDAADAIEMDTHETFDEIMAACMAYKDSEPTTAQQAHSQYVLGCAHIQAAIAAMAVNLQKAMDSLLVLKKLQAEGE